MSILAFYSTKMRTRIIELSSNEQQEASDVFTDRMPLETLRKVWGESTEQYTDKQLFKMREFAYILCEVLYKIINRQDTKIISLTHEQINERQEGDSIRAGKYRRAS
jgi:hypothetical protein